MSRGFPLLPESDGEFRRILVKFRPGRPPHHLFHAGASCVLAARFVQNFQTITTRAGTCSGAVRVAQAPAVEGSLCGASFSGEASSMLCALSFLRRSPGKQNRAASGRAALGADFRRSRVPDGNDDLREDTLGTRGFHAALRGRSLWGFAESAGLIIIEKTVPSTGGKEAILLLR